MSNYKLTWVTDLLAAGHAPLSYAELDSIKAAGIEAIVNLCGEYCDLHGIQQKAGFEVCYLPIPDECAPEMGELVGAIDWVTGFINQGKKVLVHCRFGVGRTGTFLTAYLMSTGLDLKAASKLLQDCRANPTNYCQWKMLRKYQKKMKQGGTIGKK